MVNMTKQSLRYKTQWASQFYVAAELTRRGYLVSFPLGNAPVIDLLAVSPTGKHFMVDVKGQATKSFWLIRERELKDDLFYILVYLPKGGESPQYYIFSCGELMREREAYRNYIEKRYSDGKGKRYREDFGGINWSTALKYKDRWDILPE